MTFILVDMANLYHRSKHVVRSDNIDEKIGMSMHIMLFSIANMWKKLNGTHVVACFEGRSWRKDFYEPYKANRKERTAKMTPRELEEDQLFLEAFNDLQDFISEKTNMTVLQSNGCEADDFIARWIQNHPNDDHVIVSSDSDFFQLIAPNVKQYNGINETLITIDGIFNAKGKPVIDKKTGEPKTIGDPEWVLFEKCVRGDISDNIFSAYPGVRTKGTKNKVGIIQAFEDRNTKGFNYNNFMLTRWVDHRDVEHVVKDDYERNRTLIDLTCQPDHIKNRLDEVIVESVQAEPKPQVGLHFMRFCGKYGLDRAGQNAADHIGYLKATYA